MRVLMLNNEFPPLGGGTGTVNESIIRQLASFNDVRIDLVTSSLTKSRYEAEQYLPNVSIFKVPVRNSNIHHSTNRELLTYAWRAFFLSLRRSRGAPYDVCLAFSTVPAGGVALGLWYTQDLPFVVRVSGPDIPGFEERYAVATRILAPVIRLTWRIAAQVIVKCPHEQALVTNAYPQACTVVVPNAVDCERFCPVSRKPSDADRVIRVVCVARLIERKGHRFLIDAAHLLHRRGHLEFKILLVGQGDAEAALKAQAQDLGIGGQVDFCGYVPRKRMPDVYAAADIFVLPSFNEGMSVATLEAMAAGLPVVVTQGSGLEELVDDNGLTFPRADARGLALALEQLMASVQLRKRMGRKSRCIAQQFSWECVGSAYYELLLSVAHQSRKSCPY